MTSRELPLASRLLSLLLPQGLHHQRAIPIAHATAPHLLIWYPFLSLPPLPPFSGSLFLTHVASWLLFFLSTTTPQIARTASRMALFPHCVNTKMCRVDTALAQPDTFLLEERPDTIPLLSYSRDTIPSCTTHRSRFHLLHQPPRTIQPMPTSALLSPASCTIALALAAIFVPHISQDPIVHPSYSYASGALIVTAGHTRSF